MALIPSALASDMKSSTLNAPDSHIALMALSNSISSYIMNNAQVMFAWVGIGPPPTSAPDPAVVATGKISGVVINITPSMATTQAQALPMLALQIRTGVSSGIYTVDSPWSCSPGSLIAIPPLTISITGTNRDAAFLMFATQICTWIQGFIPPIPCSGTHAAFTGVATPTAIL